MFKYDRNRAPTFPNCQNSKISPGFSGNFQAFFIIFKWLQNSFESKFGNLTSFI